MDRNLLLAFALSFLVLSLWTLFQEGGRRGQRPPGAGEEIAGEVAPPGAEMATQTAVPLPASEPLASAPAEPAPLPTGEKVRVERELFEAELDTVGAALARWQLREYDQGPHHDHLPVILTTAGRSLLTPFEELGQGDLSRQPFSLEQPDANTFAFFFRREGIAVHKTYEFEESRYAFRLRLEVVNESSGNVAPRFALVWSARQDAAPDFKEQGLVAYHEGSIERQALRQLGRGGFFSSAKPVHDYPSNVDWAGVGTTYFLSAAFPDVPAQASARFQALEPGEAGTSQLFFPPVELAPGQRAAREYRVYLGPKEVERLKALGAGAIHSLDFGWSWFAPMTRFFAWLLGVLYAIVPNHGVDIILLTILVRVVTAPLTTRQMRSMERMRELQPKLKALQEQYPDDRQKQSEETMRLYRSEGVNPLGGCLPMVLQLPVMIGLFYALRSSIDLRQSPFFGWIDDLSAPETLFVIPGPDLPVRLLPLIMGGTMVLQQRMTPMNVDPTQARMMMTVMPIMMTFLFYQFASGLVLYWMVGNVLAIAHQLWIRRQRAAKE